jgi:hypothetical protein
VSGSVIELSLPCRNTGNITILGTRETHGLRLKVTMSSSCNIVRPAEAECFVIYYARPK